MLSEQHSWMQNLFAPYNENVNAGLSSRKEDSLVELSCDNCFESDLHTETLGTFLDVCLLRIYLSDKALMFLTPFATTYLCETGFSALLALNRKYRSKLDVGPEHSLKLTCIQPDKKILTAAMQLRDPSY